MTKKEITIANALKPFYDNDMYWDITNKKYILVDIINAISKAMNKDNPKFDPIKFLEYLSV